MPSMPNLGSFPSFDFSNLDLSKLAADLPKVDLPSVNLPKVELPRVELDTDRVAGFARDAAYVGVGLTVLAVQQVQVRRRELQATIERHARKLADTVA